MHTRTKIQEPRVSKRKVHKNYTTTAFPHPLSRLTPVISTPNHTNSVMGNETRIAQCPYRSMLPRKAPSRAMPSYAALLNSVPSSAGRRLDVRYSAVNSFPYTNRPQAHNASCEYYQFSYVTHAMHILHHIRASIRVAGVNLINYIQLPSVPLTMHYKHSATTRGKKNEFEKSDFNSFTND